MCPCSSNVFIGFWVNSLVPLNEDYWTLPTFCTNDRKLIELTLQKQNFPIFLLKNKNIPLKKNITTKEQVGGLKQMG
jgi:hypothetical protein